MQHPLLVPMEGDLHAVCRDGETDDRSRKTRSAERQRVAPEGIYGRGNLTSTRPPDWISSPTSQFHGTARGARSGSPSVGTPGGKLKTAKRRLFKDSFRWAALPPMARRVPATLGTLRCGGR